MSYKPDLLSLKQLLQAWGFFRRSVFPWRYAIWN